MVLLRFQSNPGAVLMWCDSKWTNHQYLVMEQFQKLNYTYIHLLIGKSVQETILELICLYVCKSFGSMVICVHITAGIFSD